MKIDLPDKFDVVDIVVNGQVITAPVIPELRLSDIGEGLDHAAYYMGYWGNVLGHAESELIIADTKYRSWKANFIEDLIQSDAKLSEWKVKNAVEANPKFLEHKANIAIATRNVQVLRNLFQAFDKKANLLQSRGANERQILEKTGLRVTSSTAGKSASKQQQEKRQAKMRKIFKKDKEDGQEQEQE